jgi:hypothetical protein
MFAHGLLFAALMAPGGTMQREPSAPRSQPHVVLIAPPKGVPDTAPPPRRPEGTYGPRPIGISIDLDQLLLSICDDPSYDLIEVLRQSDGYLGIADVDNPTGPVRYVDRVFRVSDGGAEHEFAVSLGLDDYFAVRLISPQHWMRAIDHRHQIEIGATAVVFALFPESFAEQLISSIRESAMKKGLSAVKSVTIRFDRRAAQGVVIDEIG